MEIRFWIVHNMKNTVAESTLRKGLAKLCSSWSFLSILSADPFPVFTAVQPWGDIAFTTSSCKMWYWLLNKRHKSQQRALRPGMIVIQKDFRCANVCQRRCILHFPHPILTAKINLTLSIAFSDNYNLSLCWVSVVKSYLALAVSQLLDRFVFIYSRLS